MDFLKLAISITEQYRASIKRGKTKAYLEGAQIGRLKLSHKLCPYAEGTALCVDWRRGYFMELGRMDSRA